MNDLLKKLITQAKQEGRENLRVLVAALNGQAAIHILTKKVSELNVNYMYMYMLYNDNKDINYMYIKVTIITVVQTSNH